MNKPTKNSDIFPELTGELSIIKKLVDSGTSQRKVAKTYGVSHTTIQNYIKLINEYELLRQIHKVHERR